MTSYSFDDITKIGDKPLGVGSFGEVWRCKVKGIAQDVAVKFFTLPNFTYEQVCSFEKEVQFLMYVCFDA